MTLVKKLGQKNDLRYSGGISPPTFKAFNFQVHFGNVKMKKGRVLDIFWFIMGIRIII